MGTRFFYQSTGSVLYSPGYNADWEAQWNVERHPCSPTKAGSAFYARNPWLFSGSSPRDILHYQFVCGERLAAQTISGTVKGQVRAKEASTADDLCGAIIIKVVKPDLTTRGTLLSYFPGALTSEYATTYTNRYLPPAGTALSSVTCQDGDVIVIEMGARSFNPNNQTHYMEIGDASGSDLPENETGTDQCNPWLEFSATLTFLAQVEVDGQAVQAGYEAAPGLQINATGLMAAYSLIPDYGTVQLNGMGVQVAYNVIAYNERRVFPVAPVQRFKQSQAWKRNFPV